MAIESDVVNKIIELRKNGISMFKIAEHLDISKGTVKYYCKKYGYEGIIAYHGGIEKDVDKIIRQLEIKHSKFEYIGGYGGTDSYMYVMCKDCGEIRKRSTQVLKPSRNHKLYQCRNCTAILKELDDKRKKKEKEEQQRRKEELKKARLKQQEEEKNNRVKTKECIVCGECFKTTNDRVKCCSKECSKKHINRNKDKRIYKNSVPDLSISLEKLMKRDENKCHICGYKCDANDYWYNGDGHFIAGEDYPSIDHVIPIAKGGTHEWDNVRLAHRSCNSLKRDNECYGSEGKQMKLIL